MKKLFLTVIFLLYVVSAFAATSFKCVIKPTGGDYSSLASWEAAIDSNLTTARVLSHSGITGTIADGATVTGATSLAVGTALHVTATQIMIVMTSGTFQSGEQIYALLNVNFVTSTSSPDSVIATAEIDGDWSGGADTTAVDMSGWITDATRYIHVYTTGAARHKGVYSTSYYVLFPSTDSIPFRVSNNIDTSKFIIDGLQINGVNKTGAGGEGTGGCIFFTAYQANTTIKNNIIKSKSYTGIDVTQCRGTCLIYNNIIYDTDKTAYSDGIAHEGSSAVYIYNNTIYGFYRGLHRNAAGLTIKNDVILNSGETSINGTIPSGSNNATYDGKGDDSPLTAGLVNKTSYSNYFVSVTAGSEDFHLKSGSDFIDVGTDLSATFTDDIDGATRSGTWDIGADEFVPTTARRIGLAL